MAKTFKEFLKMDTGLEEGSHYHSVWSKGEKGWTHHFDADNAEDAKSERDSLKSNGERVKILRVAKDKADWRKQEHRDAAIKLLGESEELDDDQLVDVLAEGKYIKKEDAKFKEGETVGHMFGSRANTTGTVKKVDNNGNHHVELHDRKDLDGKPVVKVFNYLGHDKSKYSSDRIVSHDHYKEAIAERDKKVAAHAEAQSKANSEANSPEHKKIIDGFHKHYPDLNLHNLQHVSSSSNRDGTTSHYYETHLPIDGPTKHLFKTLKAEVHVYNSGGKHSGSLSYRYEHPGGGSNGHRISDIYQHEGKYHIAHSGGGEHKKLNESRRGPDRRDKANSTAESSAKYHDDQNEWHTKRAEKYEDANDREGADLHYQAASYHKSAARQFRKFAESTNKEDRIKHENTACNYADMAEEHASKNGLATKGNDNSSFSESTESSKEKLLEISRKTLGSYINKASDAMAQSRFVNGMNANMKINSTDKKQREILDKYITDNSKYQEKRRKGIDQAVEKLTKD